MLDSSQRDILKWKEKIRELKTRTDTSLSVMTCMEGQPPELSIVVAYKCTSYMYMYMYSTCTVYTYMLELHNINLTAFPSWFALTVTLFLSLSPFLPSPPLKECIELIMVDAKKKKAHWKEQLQHLAIQCLWMHREALLLKGAVTTLVLEDNKDNVKQCRELVSIIIIAYMHVIIQCTCTCMPLYVIVRRLA